MQKFGSDITPRASLDKHKSHFLPPQELLIPAGHITRNKQFRQRNPLKLASDSSSRSSSTTDEDMSSLSFEWKSSKQASGVPIKKLLADEMSKETESKRRTPGVIARLMGLDGLPSQQPSYSKDSSDRRTWIERARSGSLDDYRSSRRSSKDQQEFKDVFEVSEIPEVESSRDSPQGNMDTKLTDPEMLFIQQKFMDAKRLSTDRTLQNSKEFDDALEVLDSNKDLLLKYFEHPDSLLAKHLNDLQAAPFHLHSSQIEAKKSLESQKYDGGNLSWNPERAGAHFKCSKSYQKCRNGSLGHFDSRQNRRATHNSSESSKFHLEGEKGSGAYPTRIVVLKPNLGKVRNSTKTVLPSEIPNIRNRESEMQGKKYIPEVLLSRQNSAEFREIAKEITSQMKNTINSGSVSFSSSRFRGYVKEERLCNSIGNESQMTTATLRKPSDLSDRHRLSLSHSSESSVIREAKKRLSERWKMTHKSQDGHLTSRGSTLAEMLAIPDSDTKPAQFDAIFSGDYHRPKILSDDALAEWAEPLGISSRDGWKGGYIQNLPRSKSLPASSTVFESPRTNLCHEALFKDGCLIQKQKFKREKSKMRKGSEQGLGAKRRKPKSSSRKPRSACNIYSESDECSLEKDIYQNKVNVNPEGDSPLMKKVVVSETLLDKHADINPVLEKVVDVGHDILSISSRSPDELRSESSPFNFVLDDSGDAVQSNSMQQGLSVGSLDKCSVSSQNPSSCKDAADQPSPVSVLEPSFIDDLSSCSECFEGLSADLHGLRMQLQLLKSESEAYTEGPVMISSDEDGGELCLGISNENMCRTEDSWESSYIHDVLMDSGFIGAHPDTLMTVWYSPECPVNPSLFDELEEKYYDQTSCPKSERRLLFDRINSGLFEIHQQFTDPHPWVSPSTTKLGSKLFKRGIQASLFMLLESQEKKVNEGSVEEVLVRETQWVDLRDHIDVIGKEVERLLIDEVIAEIAVI